ncbi:hypothetical protein [Solibacillus sp. R5-41]|uniref:hypothetical protein n=1 Tax=Solibacillus sp. R5-41 TaxID=2048654 RepID=UPI0012FE3A28|nr:hypothetical protein [Solibacillus sp. R5-41]
MKIIELHMQLFFLNNPNVFKRLREEILIPKKQLAEKRSPHKYLLKEIGIEPFF